MASNNGRTGAGRARAQAARSKAALPPRVASQAQAAADELARLDYLREMCDLRQGARGHEGDHPYATGEDGGDVLSYDGYREFLDGYEARLRDLISPAAMKIAERQMKQRDQEAVATSGG